MKTNCFYANAQGMSAGIPLSCDGKGYYIDLGRGRRLPVYSAASVVDGVMTSASFWDSDKLHTFGMRKNDDASFYVLIDTSFGEDKTGLQGVSSASGVELDRGRIGTGSLFVYQLKAGDDMAYCVAGNRLLGFTATEEGFEPFTVDNEAEVIGSLTVSEGMRLISLEGEKARPAIQAGAHMLIDAFKNGADAGEQVLDALMSARAKQLLDHGALNRYTNEIAPRLISLVEGYGWPMKRNGAQVFLVRNGHSFTLYDVANQQKPSRQQIEARRAAHREERLADRPKGISGGTADKGGKKQKGKKH